MRAHPIVGEAIVKPLSSGASLLPIIRHHHERWDGAGYPDGLSGDAIPIGSRIVNACDALQNQKAEDRTLTICTGPSQNGEVQISFEDSGSGVAPEMLGNLFEPFVTSKQLGLGLGLSVCQSIIGAHGGRLWASNTPGRGATFWISLPATSGVDR